MARQLRLEYPGALWHVTSRGNAGQAIFTDDGDRLAFLSILARVVGTFAWRLHAWVLMDNHFHLLLETPEPTLSRGMRQLNGITTQRFNARHARAGHLFQGRFKSILIERQAHLLELARYVVLNPVRAGVVESPGEWRWSSYRATAGEEEPPAWLDVDWLLAMFDEENVRRARKLYAGFVAEGIEARYRPWQHVRGGIYLGGDGFIAEAADRLRRRTTSREHPRSQRTLLGTSAEDLIAATAAAFLTTPEALRRHKRGAARKAAAYIGRADLALPLKDLGPHLGVAEWSVTNLAKAGERLADEDDAFRAALQAIREHLGA